MSHGSGDREGNGMAWGAISFVNAIPMGVGASAAISLNCRSRVEIRKKPDGGTLEVAVNGEPTSEFLQMVARMTLRRLDEGKNWSLSVHLDSTIPLGKGLKSSSAVSVSLARAIADAFGIALAPVDLAQISAQCARDSGISVTGAFDDAITSASGGVTVADAKAFQVLLETGLPKGLQAVLWLPSGTHPSPSEIRQCFRGSGERAREAARLAREGSLFPAMALNTALVEEALGYDYQELHEVGHLVGALASGVSGNGPALAYIIPRPLTEGLRKALKGRSGETMVTDFVERGASL